MTAGIPNSFDPKAFLNHLLGDFNSKDRREKIAKKLAKRIGRKRPFAESYVYNVAAGFQSVSPRGEFYLAIRSAWMAYMGGHDIAGAYEPMEVRAIPDRVEPGALILGESIRCNYLQCNIPFVPNVPWQKYCCSEHQREDKKEIK